jgi:hypothetical protein
MANATQASRANSTRLIHVACKLPWGITLEIFEDTPLQATPGVSPLAFKPPATKAKVTLRGANSVRNDFTLRALSQEFYPYGVTQVPADFWDQWIARNRDLAFVRNGFVFALDRERELVAEAKQRESERTGLEPLKPLCEEDPRMGVSRNSETRVHTDREHLTKLNNVNGK